MSTRCHIIVQAMDYNVNVILYRHCDGYPDGRHGVLATLVPLVARFLEHRGWDPEYLAAHIIADQIRRSREYRLSRIGSDNPLQMYPARVLDQLNREREDVENDFTGFGICNSIHGDVDFLYYVRQDGIVVRDRRNNTLTTPEEAKAMLKGEIPKRYLDEDEDEED